MTRMEITNIRLIAVITRAMTIIMLNSLIIFMIRMRIKIITIKIPPMYLPGGLWRVCFDALGLWRARPRPPRACAPEHARTLSHPARTLPPRVGALLLGQARETNHWKLIGRLGITTWTGSGTMGNHRELIGRLGITAGTGSGNNRKPMEINREAGPYFSDSFKGYVRTPIS